MFPLLIQPQARALMMLRVLRTLLIMLVGMLLRQLVTPVMLLRVERKRKRKRMMRHRRHRHRKHRLALRPPDLLSSGTCHWRTHTAMVRMDAGTSSRSTRGDGSIMRPTTAAVIARAAMVVLPNAKV